MISIKKNGLQKNVHVSSKVENIVQSALNDVKKVIAVTDMNSVDEILSPRSK